PPPIRVISSLQEGGEAERGKCAREHWAHLFGRTSLGWEEGSHRSLLPSVCSPPHRRGRRPTGGEEGTCSGVHADDLLLVRGDDAAGDAQIEHEEAALRGVLGGPG